MPGYVWRLGALLIVWPALQHIRHRLHSLWLLKCADCPPLQTLLMRILGSNPELQVKFILDSTSFPELIRLRQAYGQEIEHRVLYLTRTWAFAIHRAKLKLLGRWPEYQTKKKSAPPKHQNTSPHSPESKGLTNDRTDIVTSMRNPAINFERSTTKTIIYKINLKVKTCQLIKFQNTLIVCPLENSWSHLKTLLLIPIIKYLLSSHNLPAVKASKNHTISFMTIPCETYKTRQLYTELRVPKCVTAILTLYPCFERQKL